MFSGCKTKTSLINKETGIKVTLPGKANTIEPISLENKFSNQFYHKIDNNFTFRWDQNYAVNSEVYIGFRFSSENIFIDPEKHARDLAGVTKATSSTFEKENKNINNCDYLLFYYMKMNDSEDYFVTFHSDLFNPTQIWGRIRFPATYPLDRIKKETYDILRGIEFKKK